MSDNTPTTFSQEDLYSMPVFGTPLGQCTAGHLIWAAEKEMEMARNHARNAEFYQALVERMRESP